MDAVVFYSQLALSLVVCALLAKWFLTPRLAELSQAQALLLVLIPQAFRHFGLYGITQADFEPFLPKAWAYPVATGDMATQISTVIAMIILRTGSGSSIAWAWICTIIGTADFLYSSYLTVALQVPIHKMLAGWFLPTFYFPLVILGHWYAWRLLLFGRLPTPARTATASSLR